ncbi:MAG TPA: glutathione S-transferase N-terminal domain-containing protein [Methylovirgula sp.]|nr:glutathione S-transferase N-terminal domain-containing protein [Methylovirgula sp.]
MMILRSSPPSPFGRKVKIAASLVGLHDEIEVVKTDTSDPDETLRTQNPLCKIPVLILEDGTIIFDSRVIVEYFDLRAGGNRLLPSESKARIKVLTDCALADGILDAALLLVYEKRFRPPETHSQKWLALQNEKVARGLAAFAAAPPGGRRDAAHIGLACALGYLDLRLGGTWRADCPSLVPWLDAFAAEVPAFEATRVRSDN